MWKYRDWVIKALNDDMPFDRFTVEQIAGDMLPNATTDQLIASGFHRNTLLNQEGGIDVEEARWETLVDRVNTTATVWLGSTIACAQCHNHKYDPFSQRDYYRLLAFFDNVEYSVFGQQGGDHFIQEPTIDLPTPDQEKRRSTLAAELKSLEARLNDPDDKLDAAYPRGKKTCARPTPPGRHSCRTRQAPTRQRSPSKTTDRSSPRASIRASISIELRDRSARVRSPDSGSKPSPTSPFPTAALDAMRMATSS